MKRQIYTLKNRGKGNLNDITSNQLYKIENDIIAKTSELINDGDTGDSPYSTIDYVLNELGYYIPLSQKAQIGGVATLDAFGKIPNNQLPALAIIDTFVVSSEVAMLALSTAETGDVAIRTDINKSFILSATPSSTLSNWKELLSPTDSVTSVDGQVGAVNLSTVYQAVLGYTAANDANVIHTTGNESRTGNLENIGNLSVGLASETSGNRKAITLGVGGYAAPGGFNTNSNGDKIIFYQGSDFDGRFGVSNLGDVWLKAFSTSTVGQSFGSFNIWTGNGNSALANRMTVSGIGNIGINNTNPSEKLDVVGNGKFTGTVEIADGTTDTHAINKGQLETRVPNPMVILTQTAYDLLTPDANTLYFIRP